METAKESVCVHHWLIEPPDGPTSAGVCKLCEAVQDFGNYAVIGFDVIVHRHKGRRKEVAIRES